VNVYVFLFDQVEVLDFAGPFEVFATAARLRQRDDAADPQLAWPQAIAQRPGTYAMRGGLEVTARCGFGSESAPGILVVPGGVVEKEIANPAVRAWLRACSQAGFLLTSVCTGAFLLAEAGLLDGKRATTHWEDIDELQARYPQVRVCKGERYVDEDTVITSAGISAGIDASLHVVARMFGLDLARRTARQMEYDGRFQDET
jgi:transcriptional regulator GlxA family with amidase domain